MQKEDILCLAILPDDVIVGRRYARLSIHYTFDRMDFGLREETAFTRRLAKIVQGKTCEATLVRFLRDHGIAHTTHDGVTPHTDPDRFDLRILNQIVDLKTFAVPRAVATPTRLLNCLCLVPDHHARDQWSRRGRYARFVFGFLRGRFSVRLTPGVYESLQAKIPVNDDDMQIEETPMQLYISAAPSIAECERRFRKIRRGTRCPQYPRGTRIDNMGCRAGDLPSFREFINF
jgi:hypothetical protein